MRFLTYRLAYDEHWRGGEPVIVPEKTTIEANPGSYG
jgi:hypothetical protein